MRRRLTVLISVLAVPLAACGTASQVTASDGDGDSSSSAVSSVSIPETTDLPPGVDLTAPSPDDLVLPANENDRSSPVGRMCWTSHDVGNAMLGLGTYQFTEEGPIPGKPLSPSDSAFEGEQLQRSAELAISRVQDAIAAGRSELDEVIPSLPAEITDFGLKLQTVFARTDAALASAKGTPVERAQAIQDAYEGSDRFEDFPGFKALESSGQCSSL